MTGILLIDKPEGITSAEVVRRVKRQCGAKVGHLGTLDPFATGILPLCLGGATRIAQFLNVADKRYEGRILLGAATDTGDCTGQVVRRAPVPPLEAAQLDEVARQFTGEVRQVPPMYSAIKRDGVPLYKLARRGVEVEREARTVTITALSLRPAGPDAIAFEVDCSKGTYVRVLAEDIGRTLGTEAHLTALRRTRFGPFDIATALPLDRIGPEPPPLVPIEQALSQLPVLRLAAHEVEHIRHGRTRFLERLTLPAAGEILLLDCADRAVAVLVHEAGQWRIGRVLEAAEEGACGGPAAGRPSAT